MLAALNQQIVSNLEALAIGWIAVAGEVSAPKPAAARDRRRKKVAKA